MIFKAAVTKTQNLKVRILFFSDHAAETFKHVLFDFRNVRGQNLVCLLEIPPGDGIENITMSGINRIHEINKKDAAPVFKVKQVKKVFEDFLLHSAPGKGRQGQVKVHVLEKTLVEVNPG